MKLLWFQPPRWAMRAKWLWVGVIAGCVTTQPLPPAMPALPGLSDPPSVLMPELTVPRFTRRLVDAEATGCEVAETQMRWHYAGYVGEWQSIMGCQRTGQVLQACQWMCL